MPPLPHKHRRADARRRALRYGPVEVESARAPVRGSLLAASARLAPAPGVSLACGGGVLADSRACGHGPLWLRRQIPACRWLLTQTQALRSYPLAVSAAHTRRSFPRTGRNHFPAYRRLVRIEDIVLSTPEADSALVERTLRGDLRAFVVLGGFARERVERLAYQLDFPVPLGPSPRSASSPCSRSPPRHRSRSQQSCC